MSHQSSFIFYFFLQCHDFRNSRECCGLIASVETGTVTLQQLELTLKMLWPPSHLNCASNKEFAFKSFCQIQTFIYFFVYVLCLFFSAFSPIAVLERLVVICIDLPNNVRLLFQVTMLKNGTAIPFHKKVCPGCHNVPKSKEWMLAPESSGLHVFHIGKRLGYFVHWEPIFIGTNRDPLYDERLSWEGKSDKMTQVSIFI